MFHKITRRQCPDDLKSHISHTRVLINIKPDFFIAFKRENYIKPALQPIVTTTVIGKYKSNSDLSTF